jgi:hypothetical protein
MLRKIRLSSFGLIVGSILTVMGAIAYARGNATLNLAGFFYGLPLLLGGLALKASEIRPVPFSEPTSPSVLQLRRQQATIAQKKLLNEVTRYRYGQEAHLDEALAKLGLSPSDEERPVLIGLRETAIDLAYCLTLEFESPSLPLPRWQDRREKIQRYFGPGIRAEISQPGEDRIDLSLIAVAPA